MTANVYELNRKQGGSHVQSIMRKIRRRLNAMPEVKKDNQLARRVAIGVIRKGDRYVPPTEWELYWSLSKYFRRVNGKGCRYTIKWEEEE